MRRCRRGELAFWARMNYLVFTMLSRGLVWLWVICHYLRCVCSFPRLVQSDVDGRNGGVSYHAGTNVQKDDQQDSGRHDFGYDGRQDVRREKRIRVGLGVRRGEVGPIALGMKAISRLAKREHPHAFQRSGCAIPKSHNSVVHIMTMVQSLEVHKTLKTPAKFLKKKLRINLSVGDC